MSVECILLISSEKSNDNLGLYIIIYIYIYKNKILNKKEGRNEKYSLQNDHK